MADKTISEDLAQLLGLGSTTVEWPYSEHALVELIQLQREKEVTKQQYFRLENVTKTTELLNRALSVNIPPALIPSLFSGETPNNELMARLISTTTTTATPLGSNMNPPTPSRSAAAPPRQQNHQQPAPPPPMPQMQQTRGPPMSSPRRPLYANYQQPQIHQQPYGNLGPPVSFHTQLSQQQQQQQPSRANSPAKIGAAAVAQLERSRYPSSPVHKRTMSTPMPSFHHHTPIPPVHITSPQAGHQNTMMGTMNSIQFINENPGRKRRRMSKDRDDEADATEDEDESEKKEPPKSDRKTRHTRTRSENFVYDAKKDGAEPKVPENKVAPLVKKFEEGATTPSSGPKFANNILSSA